MHHALWQIVNLALIERFPCGRGGDFEGRHFCVDGHLIIDTAHFERRLYGDAIVRVQPDTFADIAFEAGTLDGNGVRSPTCLEELKWPCGWFGNQT